MPRTCNTAGAALLAILVAAVPGCGRRPDSSGTSAEPPNILWILLDTVRVDRLSVYGYERPTTPRLAEFSRGARVYENCQSPGSITVTSHGSFFTGLLPSEHGADNRQRVLADPHATLAELLKQRGYETYLWSANPNISAEQGFAQGFDRAEHPWDPAHMRAAGSILDEKLREYREEASVSQQLRTSPPKRQFRASGALVPGALNDWLAKRTPGRPYFAFLNYMEAHRPLLPPRRLREKLMTAEQVSASYRVDLSWDGVFEYTLGLREYTPDELAINSATYDAALAELDELIHELLESLRGEGRLENTIVIVTSDHGEHLGEHHMLEHQFSVYQELLHVPLIVHYPAKFAAGRDNRPVMTHDLFPTLLELAGAQRPASGSAVSLLRPLEKRARVSEYPAPLEHVLRESAAKHPRFDAAKWRRGLRAYAEKPFKLIQGSDERRELYELDADPRELRDLAGESGAIADRLRASLERFTATLQRPGSTRPAAPPMSPAQRERLQSLGYVGESDDGDDDVPEEKRP